LSILRGAQNALRLALGIVLASVLVLASIYVTTIFPLRPESWRPLKHIVAYADSYSPDELQFLASRFDLLIVQPDFNITALKKLNQRVKVLLYVNVMAMHKYYPDWNVIGEDYFVRDETGSRLVNIRWGWYLMDVGNQGWREYLVSSTKRVLAQGYDGIFADDVWDSLSDAFRRETDGKRAIVPKEKVESFRADMVKMLKALKSVAGSKLLIFNGIDPMTGDVGYFDVTDGAMVEGFIHSNPSGIDQLEWRKSLELMLMAEKKGKILLAQSSAPPTSSPSDRERVQRFAFTSYLLGAGARTYYNFAVDYTQIEYYQEWDTDLGRPLGSFRKVGDLYERQFTRGKVVVNPSPGPITARLDGVYEVAGVGKTVGGEIVLPPQSGLILFSRPPNR